MAAVQERNALALRRAASYVQLGPALSALTNSWFLRIIHSLIHKDLVTTSYSNGTNFGWFPGDGYVVGPN